MKWIALEHHPNDSRLKIAKDVCQTLNSRMGTGGGNVPMVMEVEMEVVRRLTPIECLLLQGFPDDWLDIPHKTSMTEEEVKEWNAIRKENAWINDKNFREQNEQQTIKWYNKMVDADSNKYKAIGNSIALPQWWWIVNKMDLPDGATLGSLFDGIGGFPLVWEERYGEGTARWASEIEPYPIAVTKEHFK